MKNCSFEKMFSNSTLNKIVRIIFNNYYIQVMNNNLNYL